MKYTAVITKQEDYWVGWVIEVPGANAQELTRDELLISLREAAKDILELREQESINEISSSYEKVPLTI